jgi:hypothetical protein
MLGYKHLKCLMKKGPQNLVKLSLKHNFINKYSGNLPISKGVLTP